VQKAIDREEKSAHNMKGLKEFADSILPPRKSRLETFRDLLLQKSLRTIKIPDRIFLDQMKFLIRSLGFDCYQISDSLVLPKDTNEIPADNTKIPIGFHLVEENMNRDTNSNITECLIIKLENSDKVILASCVLL
jgi:hypothetical protein